MFYLRQAISMALCDSFTSVWSLQKKKCIYILKNVGNKNKIGPHRLSLYEWKKKPHLKMSLSTEESHIVSEYSENSHFLAELPI